MEILALRRLRSMLSVTLIGGLSGLSLAMAAPAAPEAQARLQLDRDARQVMLAIFRQKDPRAVDRWFADSFVQHDPTIADGIAGMKAFAREVAASPHANITIYRVLVDHDLVLVHSKYEGLKDQPTPLISFDLFRFRSGKIVEHWGGHEPESPPNPSGRTQVDGPTQVTDLDRTEANRELVRRFKEVVTVQRHFDRAAEFIGTHYAQHASQVGDGISQLNARFTSAVGLRAGSTLIPRRYVADGNFVLALVEGNTAMGHTANWDLFRVADGKIVEHWDVISKIPPRERRLNTNDPF
ncbi:MAG: nuclear transport factor 2 family protein [Steroidobacteraceae bacterium]